MRKKKIPSPPSPPSNPFRSWQEVIRDTWLREEQAVQRLTESEGSNPPEERSLHG
jgi:hypothetical protein